MLLTLESIWPRHLQPIIKTSNYKFSNRNLLKMSLFFICNLIKLYIFQFLRKLLYCFLGKNFDTYFYTYNILFITIQYCI